MTRHAKQSPTRARLNPARALSPRPIRPRTLVAAVGATAIAATGVVVGLSGVGAGATTPISLYSNQTRVQSFATSDSRPVELGVRFASSVPGSVVGVRYYRGTAAGGSRVGSLWSYGGTRLASATFGKGTAHGWQTVSFARPVRIAANHSFIASYHNPTAGYAYQAAAFAHGTVQRNSYLRATQGVFAYGSHSTYPSQTWRDTSYLVDVLFVPDRHAKPGPKPRPEPTTPSKSKPNPAPSTPVASSPAAPPTTPKPVDPAPTPSTPSSSASAPSSGGSGGSGGSSGGAPTSRPAAGTPAGTKLTAYTGPDTITQANTIIDGKDIAKSLTIAASNVIIRNSAIHGKDDYGVMVRSGSLLIESTTISGFENGVAGDNYTARSVELTKLLDDGFKLGTNVLITGSTCHDLTPESGAHSDCAQLQSGEKNVTVENSWFDPGTGNGGDRPNAALFLAPDLGPSSPGPLVIRNNTLGGGNYTLFCVDGNNGQYFIKDITITGNRFLDNADYGPMRVNVPATVSGNTMAGTNKAVTA